MDGLLPPWPPLSAFLAASLLLALTPGPGVLYIVGRSVAHGRRGGLASVAGVALGNLAGALGAAAGLGALFAVSSAAFLAVKYAGAAYLVWLGVQALRGASAGEPAPAAGGGRLFRDGFLVALLNPKTIVFYAAFLPQFVAAGAPPVLQAAALGTIFVAVAAVTDTAYALAAGSAAPALARLRGPGRLASGALLIGLGAFAALSGRTLPNE